METKYQLPANACSLSATIDIKSNGENAKTAPVSFVARTTTPVNSGVKEIGMVVHDFAGMKLDKNRIPIDYNHEAEQVIGFANHVEVVDGELLASGALVPYSQDANDKATEVIYKSQNGIPYQASIYTGTDIVAEKISNGQTAIVNGVSINGPVTVFREWTLRGIAICPYGRDGNTLSAIALSNEGVVSVNVNETNNQTVAEIPMDAVVDTDTPATEAEAVEVAAAEEVTTPEVAPVEAVAMSEGKRFLTTFGNQGGVWFAEGKTFQEANELYVLSLKTENESLAAKLKNAESKLALNRGEESPVSGNIPVDDKSASVTKLSQNLPSGLARFAAGLKVRK